MSLVGNLIRYPINSSAAMQDFTKLSWIPLQDSRERKPERIGKIKARNKGRKRNGKKKNEDRPPTAAS